MSTTKETDSNHSSSSGIIDNKTRITQARERLGGNLKPGRQSKSHEFVKRSFHLNFILWQCCTHFLPLRVHIMPKHYCRKQWSQPDTAKKEKKRKKETFLKEVFSLLPLACMGIDETARTRALFHRDSAHNRHHTLAHSMSMEFSRKERRKNNVLCYFQNKMTQKVSSIYEPRRHK